jgi:hypothetical protein
MKKTFLFSTCLSIIALLLIPSIPAVEISLVKDVQTNVLSDSFLMTNLLSKIKKLKLAEIENQGTSNSFFESLLFHKQSNNNDGGDIDPTFFPFLGIFVYLLIAYIFFAINAMILRFIGDGIRGVISNIVGRIQQAIESVISLIVFIISIIINIASLIISAGITIGTFILDVLLIVITGIITLLLLTIQGIGNTFAKIWHGIGMVLRFIVDIIYVILDAIFPIDLLNPS